MERKNEYCSPSLPEAQNSSRYHFLQRDLGCVQCEYFSGTFRQNDRALSKATAWPTNARSNPVCCKSESVGERSQRKFKQVTV